MYRCSIFLTIFCIFRYNVFFTSSELLYCLQDKIQENHESVQWILNLIKYVITEQQSVIRYTQPYSTERVIGLFHFFIFLDSIVLLSKFYLSVKVTYTQKIWSETYNVQNSILNRMLQNIINILTWAVKKMLFSYHSFVDTCQQQLVIFSKFLKFENMNLGQKNFAFKYYLRTSEMKIKCFWSFNNNIACTR